MPLIAKFIVSAVLIVPLAFMMGMPFPIGLKTLTSWNSDASEGSLIEWAWAMNAAASVLGSISAMVIAIELGLSATLLSGAFAYLLAICLSGTLVLRSRGSVQKYAR